MLFCKARTRGEFKAKPKNRSMKRTISERILTVFGANEKASTHENLLIPSFINKLFNDRAEKGYLQTLKNPKSNFSEQLFVSFIQAFQHLLSKQNMLLSSNKILIETFYSWSQKYLHKKKFIKLFGQVILSK